MDELQGPSSLLKKQGFCVKQFFYLVFLDLPSFVLGLALCCTWRLPFLFRDLYKGKFHDGRGDTNDDPAYTIMRYQCLPWWHLGQFFHDIPVIVCLPFALLPWQCRLVRMLEYEYMGNGGWNVRGTVTKVAGLNIKPRALIIACAFLALQDIVCLVAGLVTLFSWRCGDVLVELREIKSAGFLHVMFSSFSEQDAWSEHTHMRTVRMLKNLMNLLIDIPFVLFGIVALCSGLRTMSMIRDIRAIRLFSLSPSLRCASVPLLDTLQNLLLYFIKFSQYE